MRTTLALDDDLLAQATALTGLTEKTALVREALRALIQRESTKRLALLGGAMPLLQDVPRRQVEPRAWPMPQCTSLALAPGAGATLS